MTLQKIKSDYANEQGYLTWGLLLEDVTGTVVLLNHMNEIAVRYAKACVIASLEKAAENARTWKTGNSGSWFDASVDKPSITSPENIVL